MPALEKEAKRLGSTTIFTATQVGEAMEIMGRAGLKHSGIKRGIEPILRAAEAEGATIQETATVIISSMKGMGIGFEHTGMVADTFAIASASAKTNIIALGEGLSKVAPVAKQFAMDFTEVVTAVALLQDVGVEASMSGTQMKTMFTKLAKMTPKAAQGFRKWGIEITKGGLGKDMKGTVNLIAAIAEGLDKVGGNVRKVRLISEAVGLRGSMAANILAEAHRTGRMTELLREITKNREGAAKAMSKTRQDTLLGDITRLKSAYERFRIDMATDSMPALRDLTKALTLWLQDEDNIKAAAEKLDKAVHGVQMFWKDNGDKMILMFKEFGVAVALMWEAVKLLHSLTSWMIPDIGTDVDAATKRRINEYERTGVLPPREDGTDPITVSHAGQVYDVDAKSGILYIKLDENLKTSGETFVAKMLERMGIKLAPQSGGFSSSDIIESLF
jgi:TP901 family phage tail tape measure protein